MPEPIHNGFGNGDKSVRGKTFLLFSFSLFGIITLRLLHLQVVDGEHYLNMSERNRMNVIPIEAPRGLILDRNGRTLVENRASYTISVLPDMVEDGEKVASFLSSVTGVQREEVARKIKEGEENPYDPVKIKRGADINMVSKVEENICWVPGITVQVEPRRRYPYGSLLSHLLGHTGEISQGEFNRLKERGYFKGEMVGKDGVEKVYEEFLHGANGVRYIEVNARGKELGPFPGKESKEPVPGSDIRLTIDLDLQKAAEDAFPDTLLGALVALDPNNGEILAMLSRPAYDLDLFSSVLTPEAWSRLNTDPRHPLLNRAVQSAYPPGSTAKMVAAIAGLEIGVVNENKRYLPCDGIYMFGNREYKCWNSHGSLSLSRAIIESCDIFFYQLGRNIGLENWVYYAEELGLGKPTGIDLPFESSGLVPTPEYYDRKYGKGVWTEGYLLNVSIGQGEILSTPVQLARYMAAIATGGKLVTPHVLKSVTGEKEIRGDRNWNVREVDISPYSLRFVRRSLLGAVEDDKGTGLLARVSGVKVAGKTGTAQNPHGEDHALFVTFAPFDNPSLALAIVVENSGHGGSVAAPIARKAMSAYLKNRVRNYVVDQ